MPIWPGFVVAGFVGLVYLTAGSGGTFRFPQSSYPHHILIADAWLHGQLHIREEVLAERFAPYYERSRAMLEQRYRSQGRQLSEEEWQRLRTKLKPQGMHDWSRFRGRYYGYWGPVPTALILPYVALAGLDASDVLFSCLVGMGTVLLTFLTLRRANQIGFVPCTTAAAAGLALLLGLGTVQFYLAVMGQVWFVSQVVATFFLTLAILCVLHAGSGWLWSAAAGAAFGASFLSRSSVVMTAPFFAVALYAVSRRMGPDAVHRTVRLAIAFGIPVALAGTIMLGFNYGRFGNPFEDGVGIQMSSGANPRFKRDYDQHGQFSVHYLPRNIYHYVLNPNLRRHPKTGALTFDPYGNSMFLVTPPLLFLFLSFRRRDPFTLALWLGVGTCMGMLLFFFGTGWYGFGNRYLLDLMPLAILLIALGMRGRLTRVSALLIALAILANSWGLYRFAQEQV